MTQVRRRIVEFIFGAQWQSVVPVLRVMAVFSLIGSIGVNIGDVYKAIERPDILAKLSIVELTLLLPALLYGARLGINGVAWAHAAIAAMARLIVARFAIGVSIRDVARLLSPSFGAGLWLIAASVPTLWLTADLDALTTLVSTAAIGSITYLAAFWKLDQRSVRRILQWLGPHRLAGAK